jgi:hypothetical protein
MFETIAVIVVLGLIVVAGRLLGAGTDAISGLFPSPGQPEWPRGVQEEDAPRFVFSRVA